LDDLFLTFSESIGNLAKIYATTTIIYFSINCVIIADKFRNLANQIKTMSDKSFTTIAAAHQLNLLQHNHLLLCQSVTMLNDSFGPALLLEVLFVFMGFTNTIMKILLKTKGINLLLMIRGILISSFTTNLILICISAESIRTQVSIKEKRISILCLKTSWHYFIN